MDGAIIEEGCRVIIQRGTYLRSEVVSRKKKLNVHKLHFYLDTAIGCKYGTIFKVGNNGHLTISDVGGEQPKPSQMSGDNNQYLNDDGNSQKLTKDAIMDLKAQGFQGEDIIEQLIENSETFDKKTEFSQEKYLKKKRKRHLAQITILKPTLRLVSEMLYSTASPKILELRTDAVSQILTMANIHSNINVLLLESTQSFLAGAILHRMAGFGNVVQLFNGDFPIRLLLPHFGLSEDETKILSGFPMNKINILQSLEKKALGTEVNEDFDSNFPDMETPCDADEEDCSLKNEESTTKQKRKPKHFNKPLTEKEKYMRKRNKAEEENWALELLKESSFDCLVIATKFRAKTALLKLMELVAPSRPIVVYSPYKEVLSECFVALRESKSVVNLDLTETWWRSYQVMTMRTHPQIMMDGTGGYLLTGIKVDLGLNKSPDNPGAQRIPTANPSANPIKPAPSAEEETDVKAVSSAAETSSIDPESGLDVKPTIREDSLGNNSDTDLNIKPECDCLEPPSKRTKSN